MIAADINDFRELARRRLPHFLFEYIDGGSFSQSTLKHNVDDFQTIRLRQRVMKDVSKVDLSTTFFGQSVSMPVVLAPIGIAGMYARRGEVQAARAAEAAGVPFTLSTMSCCPLDEVHRAVKEPIWLQLYMIKDRSFMHDLLGKAKALGIKTLVLTVDLQVHSARHREVRSGMSGPQTLRVKARRMLEVLRHPGWAWDVGINGRPHVLGNIASVLKDGVSMPQFIAWIGSNFDPSITWKDINWVRERWPGTLVVKGILDADDAREAVAAGVQGMVVSNHGGRQLDGANSSIRALPEIVDAVAGRATVLLDSGVRSGLDALRAMALGADGVMIGRAWAYALAAAGGPGVSRALQIIRHEMQVAMALTGQTDVKRLDRGMLLDKR
ncbi:MAG TPA: L-lactate dehydrogenase [Steroidobacteraceae bacterium]|nr:L-lactate dehydrogenase [Steroidobacteraceae bacterium]